MPGKLVLASEKIDIAHTKSIITPKNEKKEKEHPMLATFKKNMAKIGIGTPHSKWKLLPIIRYAEITRDTIYHDTGKEIPVPLKTTNVINITFKESIPVYEELVNHINSETTPFSCIRIRDTESGIHATSIIINGLHPIGYYLKSINTFIFGNLSWHKHYSEIVFPIIWPEILEKLNLN